MCCLISSEPIDDPTGRLKAIHGSHKFQKDMLSAPYASCSSFMWCCGQFIPFTSGCTQYLLRRKILDGDMENYRCFQGYFQFCFIRGGNCGESQCPDLCAFAEGCCCNCFAVSASRFHMMDKYSLDSDPCDYRLIRINNCLQLLACLCNIVAIFVKEVRSLSSIIDRIADVFYHCVSGCMTAQTAFEKDYQHHLQVHLRDHRYDAQSLVGGGMMMGPDAQAAAAVGWDESKSTSVIAKPING